MPVCTVVSQTVSIVAAFPAKRESRRVCAGIDRLVLGVSLGVGSARDRLRGVYLSGSACSFHRNGECRIALAIFSLFGCRSASIAFTISGPIRVMRSIWLT